jgi:hypothetical protein
MAIDAAPSDVAARPRPAQLLERDRGDGVAPSTAVPTAPPLARAPDGGGWGVPLAVLIVGMFMSILDISIVNVAIPTMQRDFSATTEQIQWWRTPTRWPWASSSR